MPSLSFDLVSAQSNSAYNDSRAFYGLQRAAYMLESSIIKSGKHLSPDKQAIPCPSSFSVMKWNIWAHTCEASRLPLGRTSSSPKHAEQLYGKTCFPGFCDLSKIKLLDLKVS